MDDYEKSLIWLRAWRGMWPEGFRCRISSTLHSKVKFAISMGWVKVDGMPRMLRLTKKGRRVLAQGTQLDLQFRNTVTVGDGLYNWSYVTSMAVTNPWPSRAGYIQIASF